MTLWRVLSWPWRWLKGPETSDGFGQSMADDLRYMARFRQCRRMAVTWRAPTTVEVSRWEAHPVVRRFGDLYAVATIDGREWMVRDRIWFGWPDPSEFCFFAMEGDAVWAARDFDRWPRAWTRPPDYSV